MIEDWEAELMLLKGQYAQVVKQNRELQKELQELKNEYKKYRELQDNQSK